jgi:hypothetical protein
MVGCFEEVMFEERWRRQEHEELIANQLLLSLEFHFLGVLRSNACSAR